MVFDFLRRPERPAPETKASATGPVIAYQGSGRVAWSARDVVSLTKTGFLGNPVGFRAVKLMQKRRRRCRWFCKTASGGLICIRCWI